MLAHRLEGYQEGGTEIEPHHIGDAQRFISAMSNILEEGVDPGAEACRRRAPTRDIPFALLTSFDRDSSELRALPEECPTIRHDQDIGGQVSAMLDRLSAH